MPSAPWDQPPTRRRRRETAQGQVQDLSEFKNYPIGYLHVDIAHIDLAEVQTAEGKLYMYVGVDRVSKFAFVQRVDKANIATARTFLDALVAAVPDKIDIVLTATASSSPTCRRTGQARQPNGVGIHSIVPAENTASSTG